MNVVFRTDASLQIGIGHVMRCLTLADALKSAGAEVIFICKAHIGHLKDTILKRGHQIKLLDVIDEYQSTDNNEPVHANWLGTNWEKDAEETLAVIGKKKTDWIVVDHYAIDARWEVAVQKKNCRIMVIDDLADRAHDCSLLLDQTFNRVQSFYKSLVPGDCNILTGSKYALLRPEFAELRKYSLHRRKSFFMRNILVTLGGVDQHNITSKILDVLKECKLPDNCKINIIMGNTSPWINSINEAATKLPWATEVLINVDNMAQIMADSDLCIGAAGSTAWERCCLGLPTMMVVLADNQKEIAAALDKSGASINLGDFSESSFLKRSVSIINNYIDNPKLNYSMVESASKVTTGEGVNFILKYLLGNDKIENNYIM